MVHFTMGPAPSLWDRVGRPGWWVRLYSMLTRLLQELKWSLPFTRCFLQRCPREVTASCLFLVIQRGLRVWLGMSMGFSSRVRQLSLSFSRLRSDSLYSSMRANISPISLYFYCFKSALLLGQFLCCWGFISHIVWKGIFSDYYVYVNNKISTNC